MTDYIDKQELLKALENVSGHADEWISLAGSIHRRIKEGEFDAKPPMPDGNKMVTMPCPNCFHRHMCIGGKCPNFYEGIIYLIDNAKVEAKPEREINTDYRDDVLRMHQLSIDALEKRVERLELPKYLCSSPLRLCSRIASPNGLLEICPKNCGTCEKLVGVRYDP